MAQLLPCLAPALPRLPRRVTPNARMVQLVTPRPFSCRCDQPAFSTQRIFGLSHAAGLRAHQGILRAQSRCCRLTRTLPDLSMAEHCLWCSRIELAKRRLVSFLSGPSLPLKCMAKHPAQGLVSDLLRTSPRGVEMVTGHFDGVMTLDLAAAEYAWREQRRSALTAACPTLVDHLRHEIGHFYWQRWGARRPLAGVVSQPLRGRAAQLPRRAAATLPVWGTCRLEQPLRQRLRQLPSLGRLGRVLGALTAFA